MDANVLNGFLKDENNLEGWFYHQDMLYLAILNDIHSKNQVKGHIVEIGVYKGKSLSFLSHFIKDIETLYGYDTFPNNYYESTKLALENYGANVQYELIKADTSKLNNDDIKAKMNGKGIRILHIDAGHEYHEVFHSILSFSPYVIDAGIIVMDDYQDREFPGIEAAVLDFCEIDRPRRFVPFLSGQNKIYLCNKYMANIYQQFLLTSEDLRNTSRLTVVRDFAIIKGFSKIPTSFEEINQQLNQFYELGKNDSIYDNQKLYQLQKQAIKYSKLCSNDYDIMNKKRSENS